MSTTDFKARSFLKGVKTLYTEHINSFLNDKDKLQVFNKKEQSESRADKKKQSGENEVEQYS